MWFTLLLGALSGAGLMYFLDPRAGAKRRALLKDQAEKLKNTATDQADDLSHYAVDKSRGVVHEAASKLRTEEVSDETLVARVRSAIGRYSSHPGSIVVNSSEGHVTLTGHILANEVQALLAAVKSVPGVKDVENQMQAHVQRTKESNVQGGNTPASHS